MEKSPLRSAMVTGASRGIGKAIAAALAKQDTALSLIGRSKASLETVAVELRQSGIRLNPEVLQIDLAVPDRLEEHARHLAERIQELDLLIHCAAVYYAEPWSAVSEKALSTTFATNVSSPMLLTRHLLPALKAAGGTVVFINSSIVRTDGAAAGLYAASKQALRACADSLRAQVSKDGVRVLSVFPGRTATPLQEDIFRREGRSYRPERLLQPEDVAEAVVSSLLLATTADVTELHIRPRRNPLSDSFTG